MSRVHPIIGKAWGKSSNNFRDIAVAKELEKEYEREKGHKNNFRMPPISFFLFQSRQFRFYES